MKSIIVTGGLGYIGSHTVVALSEAGYKPVIIDNLCNSSKQTLKNLEKLTGNKIDCLAADIRETKRLIALIRDHKPEAIIHFAALKSINQSIAQPLNYYSNNVEGTLSVLDAMRQTGVKRLIFSSSAVVYGDIKKPAREDMELGQTNNPYGSTKIQCERILSDVSNAHEDWSVTSLRYFNPVGAHESSLIGENPSGTPDNLMPYLTQVAAGKLKVLNIYGDDYPTRDGTGIRDYIHVMDLAKGHVAALKSQPTGISIYNLGTGHGHSVKELINTFQKVTGQKVVHTVVGRRDGDLPDITADPSKAYKELGWKTELSLEDMCRDAWGWEQRKKPAP